MNALCAEDMPAERHARAVDLFEAEWAPDKRGAAAGRRRTSGSGRREAGPILKLARVRAGVRSGCADWVGAACRSNIGNLHGTSDRKWG